MSDHVAPVLSAVGKFLQELGPHFSDVGEGDWTFAESRAVLHLINAGLVQAECRMTLQQAKLHRAAVVIFRITEGAVNAKSLMAEAITFAGWTGRLEADTLSWLEIVRLRLTHQGELAAGDFKQGRLFPVLWTIQELARIPKITFLNVEHQDQVTGMKEANHSLGEAAGRTSGANTASRDSLRAIEERFYSKELVGNIVSDPTPPMTTKQIATCIWGPDGGENDEANDKRVRDWMKKGRLPANKVDRGLFEVSHSALELLEKAERDFSRLTELDPASATAFNFLGMAWEGKGDLDKAITNYTKSIELNPKEALTYVNRAAAWGNKGNPEMTRADLATATRLNPAIVKSLDQQHRVPDR